MEMRREGDVLIFAPRGVLGMDGERENLKRAAEEALAAGELHVVVDLEAVNFAETSGIALLAFLTRSFQKAGGRMVLCCAAHPVKSAMAIHRIDQLVEMFPGRREAIAALAAGGKPQTK